MAAASVIGRGTVVRGHVRGSGSLTIDGHVEGDVTVSGEVVVGEEGSVRGNVSGAQLSIAGAVQGDLHGSESLLVERGARIVGDLTGPRIGVAPGALVRGNVRTDGELPLAQAQRRAGVVQPLRATAPLPLTAAKPVVSAKPAQVAPLPATPAAAIEREEEPEPPKKAEAPPPVVPALGKHAKAKKKRHDG